MVEWLETDDLRLQISNTDVSQAVVEYYGRNQSFLEAFEPKREQAFFTEPYQRDCLKTEMEQAKKKEAVRFYIQTKKAPGIIIGNIALNNIVWGCFYSCFLGYKLDAQFLNRGYMTQAVSAVAEMAFDGLGLHRIEANVMPHNLASLRVLEKCGFEMEGVSKKYLKINGVWEDHIHMVKRNDGECL